MDGVDSNIISKIVLESAANSSYTTHQLKLDAAVERRIKRLLDAQQKVDDAQRQAACAKIAQRTVELEAMRTISRVVVVVDFDMFYAAVAIREDPSLADKPLAVGGALVLTANYIARRWGVRSGMPGFVAKELLRRAPEFGMPNAELTFVPADYEAYAKVADEAMAVYREYDPHTRQGMGYDEVSLDITQYLRRRVRLGSHARAMLESGVDEPRMAESAAASKPAASYAHDSDEEANGDWDASDDECDVSYAQSRGGQRHNEVQEVMAMHALADEVVAEIRARVRDVTGGLTVSAGIAPCRKIAKMGADVNKPDGQTRVANSVEAVLDFLRDRPLRKVPFIGRVTEKLCSRVLGASTCGELLQCLPEAFCLFSRVQSESLLRDALGWDDWDDEPRSEGAPQKGISFSDTFRASDDPAVLRKQLRSMCEGLARSMQAARLRGSKMTCRFKDSTFEVRSRAAAELRRPIGSADELYTRALPMLEAELKLGGGVSGTGGGGSAAAAVHVAGLTRGWTPLRLRSIGVQMTKLTQDGAPVADGLRRIDQLWTVGGPAGDMPAESGSLSAMAPGVYRAYDYEGGWTEEVLQDEEGHQETAAATAANVGSACWDASCWQEMDEWEGEERDEEVEVVEQEQEQEEEEEANGREEPEEGWWREHELTPLQLLDAGSQATAEQQERSDGYSQMTLGHKRHADTAAQQSSTGSVSAAGAHLIDPPLPMFSPSLQHKRQRQATLDRFASRARQGAGDAAVAADSHEERRVESSDDAKVLTLVEMGFVVEEARAVLRRCGHNLAATVEEMLRGA